MEKKHPNIKVLEQRERSAIKSIFDKSKAKAHIELEQLRAHFLEKMDCYHSQIYGAFTFVLKLYANDFGLNWSEIDWLIVREGKIVEVQFTRDGKPILLENKSLKVVMDRLDFKFIAEMAHKSLVFLDLSRPAHAELESHVDNAVNKGWILNKLNKR